MTSRYIFTPLFWLVSKAPLLLAHLLIIKLQRTQHVYCVVRRRLKYLHSAKLLLDGMNNIRGSWKHVLESMFGHVCWGYSFYKTQLLDKILWLIKVWSRFQNHTFIRFCQTLNSWYRIQGWFWTLMIKLQYKQPPSPQTQYVESDSKRPFVAISIKGRTAWIY